MICLGRLEPLIASTTYRSPTNKLWQNGILRGKLESSRDGTKLLHHGKAFSAGVAFRKEGLEHGGPGRAGSLMKDLVIVPMSPGAQNGKLGDWRGSIYTISTELCKRHGPY
ncbi:hypothetical protein L6452_09933 [Arctium lappa]|uniref:Uncharacterized protein n=1 Tax=Arctium lappa TaxID=4217 RepID=A0ACB9DM31_ARCLA|nr:hypothetical protein L6452_09933 [Arctium lappa]